MNVFLILNYENYSETMHCVESLLKLELRNAAIVIVDNGSKNNSYEYFKELYKHYGFIYVIKTYENLGFANGNNFGYEFIKTNLSPSCIVCLNSDVVIEDKDFISVLNDISKSTQYALIGQDIVKPVGKELWHQNPFSLDVKKEDIERNIDISKKEIADLRSSFFHRCLLYKNTIVENIRIAVKKITGIQGKSCVLDKKDSVSIQENVVLHGSCLIFTELFLQKHNLLFYPKTFLYGEEKILYLILRKEGFNTLFYPKLHVLHKHSQSTSKIEKSLVNRKIFLLEKSVESNSIILDIIENKREIRL